MKIKSPLKPQAGASFVEASIVLGVLITLFLSIMDLYFMHATYVNLSQFAREGVLSATGMPYFRVGHPSGACSGVSQSNLHAGESLPDSAMYRDCEVGNSYSPEPTCGHYLVQWRLELLMKTLNLNFVDEANRSITTSCQSFAGSPGYSRLQVDITVPFQGFTPFFRNTVLKVRQIGMVR